MSMYKLCFYVPLENAEDVKLAVFKAGAGKIGDYESCCWQVEGVGQFRPLKGANPTIGKVGAIEKVPELKVEMVFEKESAKDVLRALIDSHPYEEPAYEVWPVMTLDDF